MVRMPSAMFHLRSILKNKGHVPIILCFADPFFLNLASFFYLRRPPWPHRPWYFPNLPYGPQKHCKTVTTVVFQIIL